MNKAPLSIFEFLAQSFRSLSRDWRSGELKLLMLALVVAVGAMTSVTFFADRMNQALTGQARQLLGADRVVVADQPINPQIEQNALLGGLRTAQTVNFPSMVSATAAPALVPQLASIKAVSKAYPLRGALSIIDELGAKPRLATDIPDPDTVWMDAQLQQALQLKLGDMITLGEKQFRFARLIALEPDRGANFMNFAPRLLMRLDNLAATELVQPASRVTYRLLLAAAAQDGANEKNVSQFASGLKLKAGQRMEDLEGGRPELRTTLDRARQFLALVALLTAVIAATAIALAARRFAERHLNGCAVMRAMGATSGLVARLMLFELLWIGLAASAIGCLIGLAGHSAFIELARRFIEIDLPSPSIWPALQATGIAIILLLGFAALPIYQMARVSPLRVLRRDLQAPPAAAWIAPAMGILSCAAMASWFTNDYRLAAVAMGGIAASAFVFAGLAIGLVYGVTALRNRLPEGTSTSVRMSLASWSRRKTGSVAQIVALGIALLALLLLTVTRADLLDSWRRASPADAPNRFVINIQPDQRDAVAAALTERGVKNAQLYPMVRGRLIKINGVAALGEGERAKRLLDREFNLSYMDAEPTHNKTIEGRWIDPKQPEVSVEQGIAQTLNLKLGDQLAFTIGSNEVTAKVVGIRKLAWDSMKVNFFMVMSSAVLADQAQTLISAIHVNSNSANQIGSMVQVFPNLTIFDTDNIVRQVQGVLNQISSAVEFLFLFTLAAGALVLYASQASARDERMREAGLMRALGASRKQLSTGLLIELGLTGALAGLIAGAIAMVIGSLLARIVFEFDLPLNWVILPIGTVAGAFCAWAAGWWALRGVVNSPPMQTLREVS
jgi:putative ABC transport system permease protein